MSDSGRSASRSKRYLIVQSESRSWASRASVVAKCESEASFPILDGQASTGILTASLSLMGALAVSKVHGIVA
jgi:hypothetical protein